jgi:hypothetical protein
MDVTTQRALLPPAVLALWQRHAALPAGAANSGHRFGGQLAWLDTLPFDPADGRTA